ncbi:MAG: sulfite exporter TauE/SafE family protein [Gammaproteobacteria bacterium]
MNQLLVPAFFLTSLLYAMVGFGGGSTYAAILALTNLDYTLLPVLVLVCNLVVVTGGVVHYFRAGLLDFKFVLPLVITSVPCALLGGAIPVSQRFFLITLAAALLVSGVLLVWRRNDISGQPARPEYWNVKAPVLGGGLGFLAGLVGIGGGVFLAPILHHLKLASPKHIAAAASFFILVNSSAGLIGQLSKHSEETLAPERFGHLIWLPLAVLVGGQIGSRLSVRVLPGAWIKMLTGVLVTIVGLRLLWQNSVL